LVDRIQDRQLSGLNYWEKLEKLRLYSQERRRERYMIIFLKSLHWQLKIPNISLILTLTSEISMRTNPLYIEIAAPQSEAKDNVMEMSAAEFSKLLDDDITNFRSKQGS
jgi:hypothetical protein